MNGFSVLPLTMLALMVPGAAPASGREAQEVELAQLTIHERIIIRVPRMAVVRPQSPVPPAIAWKEKGGPRCVVAGELAGALVTQPDAVDLVLNGGRRLRARLTGDCRPLDFYSGFYLKPAGDGKVCAGRDAIRARSGATCPIDRFHSLKPERAKR